MTGKRLIGTVTVRDGWAVQSFGYTRYLPLGRPETLIENLDRWGVDEIFLNCIDRHGAGPDLGLLARLSKVGVTTPVTYAGGIIDADGAVAAIGAGADRVALDAGWLDNPDNARLVARYVGAQALLVSMPVVRREGQLSRYDYRSKQLCNFSSAFLDACAGGDVSEIIVTDCEAEGGVRHFDAAIIDAMPVANLPLIAFGGISTPKMARTILKHSRVSAVAIGNFLNYKEHSVQIFKEKLCDLGVRKPSFQSYQAGLPFNVAKL